MIAASAVFAPLRVIAAPDTGAEPPILGENISAAEIEAWKARYLVLGNDIEVSNDTDRVFLFDPGSLRWTAEGVVEGWFRAELFRPKMIDGQMVRSVRKRMAIVCRRMSYRELEVEGFLGSNLRNPARMMDVQRGPIGPFKPDSSEGKVLASACKTVDIAGWRA